MLNQVTLIGNLGKNAEFRTTQTGTSVLMLSMATKENVKDKKTGEWKTNTQWHDVIYFNGTPQLCERLTKGVLCFVTGKYKSSTYENKNGQKVTKWQVFADRVVPMDKNSNAATPARDDDMLDDEIPF